MESRYGTTALGKTETRPLPATFQRTSHLDSYNQLYSRKYERISSFALNEEESYSSKLEKPLRATAYEAGRRDPERHYAQPAYPSYSTYYKYGTSYKRYY